MKQVVLSKRNLLVLLNKLEKAERQPGSTACAIIKVDEDGEDLLVAALPDEVVYATRGAGAMIEDYISNLSTDSGNPQITLAQAEACIPECLDVAEARSVEFANGWNECIARARRFLQSFVPRSGAEKTPL